MAKITSYPFDNSINTGDTLVGTDASTRQTSQFSIGSIQNFIIENGDVITGTGTKDTIPIFTDSQGTVGDSIITYNSAGGAGNDFMEIGGTNVGNNGGAGFVSTAQFSGIDLFIQNISAFGSGNVSLLGGVIIGDQATDILQITSKVNDSTGTSSTAAGEVLVSNASGQLVWASVPGGAVVGSGTLNTIPLFTPDGTTLGDSQITQDAGANEVTIGSRLRVIDEAEFENEAIFEGAIDVRSTILDGTSLAGTNGQLLSSTGTGVSWVDDTVKYTSYVVKIEQTGTADPVLTEFENSTPFTFTATRTGVGTFDITPSSSFVDANKVYVQYGGSSTANPAVLLVKAVNTTEVRVESVNLATTSTADNFGPAYFELRIYP
tara:strand:- start:1820 stop:2950 length:1131 start_codon:yes stop_codon:yes gene_type:complete